MKNTPRLPWLDYGGQTTDELLALADAYRTDSIVAAFEEALDRKAEAARSLSGPEQVVLAVEALEREVNNGGFSQFFFNSSRQYCDRVVGALEQIGCPKAAAITRRAVAAAGDEETLDRCDHEYYAAGEDIAGRLLEFIRANRSDIRL
jgi:uncharacterized protein DUF4375